MEKDLTKIKDFDISFIGLKQGIHSFNWEIDNLFFKHFQYEEFNSANIVIELEFNKKSNLMELHFKEKGTVNVMCDLTYEPFDMPVEGEMNLVVKFGEEFDDKGDELLIIPRTEHTINVSQYIYEMVVLSLPLRKIHPGVEDGSFHPEILDKIEALTINSDDDEIEKDDDREENE